MLRIGASKVDITPPVGVPLGGYVSRASPSKGIHDPLYARAMVLRTESYSVALVSLDLLGVTREITEKARSIVSELSGIPSSAILIAATHTHSGPSVLGIHSCEKDLMTRDYLRALPGYIASAILQADSRCKEARVGFAKGTIRGWVVNRRNPTKGPVDEEILVMRAEDKEERLISAIVNFTCHGVVLGHNNLLISADYPGYVSRAIESTEGGVSLFLNGACGDINPLTPRTILERVYDRSIGTFSEARKMGFSIGGEALKLMNSIKQYHEEIELRSATKEIELPLQPLPEVSAESLDKLRKEYTHLLRAGKTREARNLRIKISLMEWLQKARRVAKGRTISIEIQAIRIGDLAILGIPGEPLVEIGLHIKKESAAPYTMVVGYANDIVGYIPTERALREGGYEATPPACILGSGTEERIVNAALKLIESLFSA